MFRPDSVVLLFLGSSCTLIIKKGWGKSGKRFAFSLHFLPVFPFFVIPLK